MILKRVLSVIQVCLWFTKMKSNGITGNVLLLHLPVHKVLKKFLILNMCLQIVMTLFCLRKRKSLCMQFLSALYKQIKVKRLSVNGKQLMTHKWSMLLYLTTQSSLQRHPWTPASFYNTLHPQRLVMDLGKVLLSHSFYIGKIKSACMIRLLSQVNACLTPPRR